MGVDVTEQRDKTEAAGRVAPGAAPATPAAQPGRVALLIQSLKTGFRELSWAPVLLLGVLSGILMPLTLATGGFLSFFAGLVPVGAGLIIARRVKGHYTHHGFMVGLIGAIVALVFLAVLLFLTPFGAASSASFVSQGSPLTLPDIYLQLASFIGLSLLAFSTFGASMAGRSEQRNRELREQIAERGGRLERVSAVRSEDDLRGLSLPQLGWYVSTLFKKQGFQFKDYRFIDKDKHLDLWMEHDGEIWHIRMTVADKVQPGTIEGLYQQMKAEGCRKGVVVTSTEFTPSAVKSAKGRPIVLVDGPTLFEIAEK